MGERAKLSLNEHLAKELLKRDDLDLDKMYSSDLKILVIAAKEEIERLNKRNETLSKELTKDSPINQSKLSTCCGIPIEEIPDLINKVDILQKENTRLGKAAYRKGRIIQEIENYLQDTKKKTFEKNFDKKYGKTFSQAKMEVYYDLENYIKKLKEIYTDE